MDTELKKIKIEQIDKMDRDCLIHLYQRHFASQAPRSITAIKRILAYKIQEIKLGTLKPKHQKLLDEFAVNPNAIADRKEIPQYQITMGQKITKEYHGRIYEVIKTEEGFIYDNQTYKSLSIIATKITGQKWSGPRFFNLRGRSASKVNTSSKRHPTFSGVTPAPHDVIPAQAGIQLNIAMDPSLSLNDNKKGEDDIKEKWNNKLNSKMILNNI